MFQGLSSHSLETMSVEGVCEVLSKMEGISSNAIQQYKERLKENNVHGRVLLFCDLDELKKVKVTARVLVVVVVVAVVVLCTLG